MGATNEVLRIIPQLDRDHKKLVFVLTDFHFLDDTDSDFFGLIESIELITIKYCKKEDLTKNERDALIPRTVSLYIDYDQLSATHKIRVEFYDTDKETLLHGKTSVIPTRDGPILR